LKVLSIPKHWKWLTAKSIIKMSLRYSSVTNNSKLMEIFLVMKCLLTPKISILAILLKRLRVRLIKVTLLMIQDKRENHLHLLLHQRKNRSQLLLLLSHLNKRQSKILHLLRKHQLQERQLHQAPQLLQLLPHLQHLLLLLPHLQLQLILL